MIENLLSSYLMSTLKLSSFFEDLFSWKKLNYFICSTFGLIYILLKLTKLVSYGGTLGSTEGAFEHSSAEALFPEDSDLVDVDICFLIHVPPVESPV